MGVSAKHKKETTNPHGHTRDLLKEKDFGRVYEDVLVETVARKRLQIWV